MRRDAYYMRLAFQVATGSKCVRARYGSVIVARTGTVLATAYNGKPAGSLNDHLCYREGLPPSATLRPNCCLHSEANALMFSDHLARFAGTIYVSGIPCPDCSLLILQSGVARLVYYDLRHPDPLDYLHDECPVAAGLVYTSEGALRHVVPAETDDLWARYGIDMERVPFTFQPGGGR